MCYNSRRETFRALLPSLSIRNHLGYSRFTSSSKTSRTPNENRLSPPVTVTQRNRPQSPTTSHAPPHQPSPLPNSHPTSFPVHNRSSSPTNPSPSLSRPSPRRKSAAPPHGPRYTSPWSSVLGSAPARAIARPGSWPRSACVTSKARFQETNNWGLRPEWRRARRGRRMWRGWRGSR